MRLLAALMLAAVCSTASAVPPLTAKDRMEDAETCVKTMLDALTASLKESGYKIRPKVTEAKEMDPRHHLKGIFVRMQLNDKFKSELNLTCDIVGEDMQIIRYMFITPWNNEEAHKSRHDVLAQMEAILQAMLTIEKHSDRAKKSAKEEWDAHIDALFQIGKPYYFEIEDVRYFIKGYKLKGTNSLHLGIIKQASRNPVPY